MDFRFLDGVKTAAELKKEKEDMKNIKADMISGREIGRASCRERV